MRWRIAQNKWNLSNAPWSGAVGIEEDDNSIAVPAMVCWFTRGWTQDEGDPNHPARRVVDLHNKSEQD